MKFKEFLEKLKQKRKQRIKNKKSINKKAGFALSLEALMGIFVFMFLAQMYFAQASAEKFKLRSAEAAKDLSQVNNAVRRLMSDFHYFPDALATLDGFSGIDTAGTVKTFNSIDFLKSKTGACTLGSIPATPVTIPSTPTKSVNVPSEGYLPCSMQSTFNSWGQKYQISIKNTGTGLDATISLSPTNIDNGKTGFKLRVARAVAFRAKSNTPELSIPAGDSYWSITPNPGISLTNPDKTDPNYGAIQIAISSNGNTDQWLSLDGTSVMRGDIKMNSNNITDLNKITGVSGNVEINADALFSGANGIYIDKDLSVDNANVRTDLNVNGKTYLNSDSNIDGNLNTTGNVVSGNTMTAKDLSVTNTKVGGVVVNASSAIYYSAIVSTGSGAISISKPTCAVGTPKIFASSTTPYGTRAGDYYGTYVNVTDGGSSWSIQAKELIDTNYDGTPEHYDKQSPGDKVLVTLKCQ